MSIDSYDKAHGHDVPSRRRKRRPARSTEQKGPRSPGITRRFEVLAREYPARASLWVFASIITIVTLLLMLPIATTTGKRATVLEAFFTAVSAVCVTGLTTVDTATYWSLFGQAVIALGITIGGLGVMTLASLLALAVSRHLGLTQRILASAERSGGMGDAGRILVGVFATSAVVELVIFCMLFPRFLAVGIPWHEALWDAVFMTISCFNNAGFVNLSGGLVPYIGDWGILLPITLAALVGAVGFPVLIDLTKNFRRPKRLSLHTKLTLTVFSTLVVLSIVMTGLLEWDNPDTFGKLTLSEKLLNSILAGTNSRSLGISVVDLGDMHSATWFITDIFMFIGGGSGSTAGGIKVTTLAVLLLAVLAEARGNHDVEVFRRRFSYGTVRLAVSVLVISVVLVMAVTCALLLLTDYSLDALLLESISAFATVGLSTGITPDLPGTAQFLLALLMFAGRLGPMTLAAALALREKRRLVRMPEARPIVG